jgi:hypothetical protein
MIAFLLRLPKIRNSSDKSRRGNQNTHFAFNKFFRNPCCLWENVEKYDRASQATDENVIRRMRMACSMSKGYRHTHGICSTACFSTATMVTRTPHDITLYVHCLSCLLLPRTQNIVHPCPKDTVARWQVLKNELIFQDDYGSYQQQAS